MSLLLDALKKAADDKQKAATLASEEEHLQADAGSIDSEVETADETNDVIDSISELPELTFPEETDESAADDEAGEALFVEPINEADAQPIAELCTDRLEPSEQDTTNSQSQANEISSDPAPEKTPPEKSVTEEPAPPSENLEVSEEALSLLIRKTNREVKLSRGLLVLFVFVATTLVIVAGAGYYYLATQDEIADLERKHRISMLAMKAKISGEKNPENTEVIRNLVSDTNLNQKVEVAKRLMAEEEIKKQVVAENVVVKQKNKKVKVALSIQKINKVDPIEEKLNLAWQAYDAGEYDEAKQNYKDVLKNEKLNRDALLGLGAIALAQEDKAKATAYYMALLEQDPRDPIATAALSGMSYDESSLEQHEAHLLAMLKNTPDAAPLNFALGNIYAQQENWKGAQQSYFSAWQHDVDNANYVFNLAISLDQLGKSEQAIDFYNLCLQKAGNTKINFSPEAVKTRIRDLSGL